MMLGGAILGSARSRDGAMETSEAAAPARKRWRRVPMIERRIWSPFRSPRFPPSPESNIDSRKALLSAGRDEAVSQIGGIAAGPLVVGLDGGEAVPAP